VLSADQVGHWFQKMVAPYDFHAVTPTLPTRTFDDELTLDVGGREVHLTEVVAAHTEGQLMVRVPDAKTLFSGDLLFIDSTPVVWAGPVENWIAALESILTMDVDVIVPGHGPVTDKAGVQQVKAYWEYVTAHVRQRYDAGMSAADAAYDIVLSKDFAQGPFSTWNSPERMMTNVHTMYRHLQGRSERLKVPELLNIMRKQALLAHALPDAQPAAMRKR
jgi:glyoxylase-like metal-dependent hydrolase (beta-lactamase superfamily II)